MSKYFTRHELGALLKEFAKRYPPHSFEHPRDFEILFHEYVAAKKDERWPRCTECGLRDCQCTQKQKGQVA
jgi:hypothetical protein